MKKYHLTILGTLFLLIGASIFYIQSGKITITLIYNGANDLPPIPYLVEIDGDVAFSDTITATPMTIFTEIKLTTGLGFHQIKLKSIENGRIAEAHIDTYVLFKKSYVFIFSRENSMVSNEEKILISVFEDEPPLSR